MPILEKKENHLPSDTHAFQKIGCHGDRSEQVTCRIFGCAHLPAQELLCHQLSE